MFLYQQGRIGLLPKTSVFRMNSTENCQNFEKWVRFARIANLIGILAQKSQKLRFRHGLHGHVENVPLAQQQRPPLLEAGLGQNQKSESQGAHVFIPKQASIHEGKRV